MTPSSLRPETQRSLALSTSFAHDLEKEAVDLARMDALLLHAKLFDILYRINGIQRKVSNKKIEKMKARTAYFDLEYLVCLGLRFVGANSKLFDAVFLIPNPFPAACLAFNVGAFRYPVSVYSESQQTVEK